MKIIFFFSVLMIVVYGCRGTLKKDEVKELIPGIYVRYYTDEYSNSFDTIEIRLTATEGSEGYIITKKTSIQKQNNEGKIAQEYQVKRWNGFYDETTKTIWLSSTGKRIYFDFARNELKIGENPYKKLRR